jgi:hypothetical protein
VLRGPGFVAHIGLIDRRPLRGPGFVAHIGLIDRRRPRRAAFVAHIGLIDRWQPRATHGLPPTVDSGAAIDSVHK